MGCYYKVCGSWAAICDSYGSSSGTVLHACTHVYTLPRGVCCSVCLIPRTSLTGTFQLLLHLVGCVLEHSQCWLTSSVRMSVCVWGKGDIRGVWYCVCTLCFWQCMLARCALWLM